MTTWRKFALGILLASVAFPAFAHSRKATLELFLSDPAENTPQFSTEKSGAIPTKQGECLRLHTNPGNVHIFTDQSAQVSYRVIVEADSRDPGAKEFLRQFNMGARRIPAGVSLEVVFPWRTFHGQFGVSINVHVPRQYGLNINTQAGNIEVQDIAGQVELFTGGGDILAGSVTPGSSSKGSNSEELNSKESSGCFSPHHSAAIAARLDTQGGRISIGNVAGTLHATTSGGHILTGNIAGDGILRTGGGQIRTGRISRVATLETGGGNIRVERSGSSATADTAGGQIDFAEAAGTIHAHTGGGAIHINRVTGPTTVETSGGGIFLGQLEAPLRVSSSSGDMIVYLPRQLAATIDAVVERGGGHTIIADPSLPLTMSRVDSGAESGTLRSEGTLNGGGETVHLEVTSGNIVLRPGELRAGWNNALSAARMSAQPEPPAMRAWNSDEEAAGFFDEVRRRILESWWGGIPVDAGEMQNHLEHSVAPVYPEVARKAGVEGDVALRVYISSEGRVTDIRVLDGPPILARAAVEAVQQWQYQALVVNGRPANVVTTLVVAFRLK